MATLIDYTQVAIPDDPAKLGLTYIAGPMTLVGPPTWNYPAFDDMANRLRAVGIPVVSPHELHPASEGTPWDWYLRRDLTQLVKCSRIVMLNDWHLSRGARLEHEVATRLELDVYYPHDYAKLGI
ncbi:hypothetical protein SEA_CZYSZCZON1_111 [Mycobacterium phage Czyszczon1]|nr:hypothetical protein SEA_CZYSZCZON1_111 [Mycobacterium phage Czyszczon1]